jgi:hypothetical protein
MTSERGQSTPFFLCFLVLMTVMVGTMVNVGQAINRRMALQILADAGAWTGATNMAIGMNGLARVNGWRHDIEPVASIGVPVAGLIGLDDVMQKIFEVGTTIINFVDMGIQIGYAKIPYDEAARVTFYNAHDLFPGEQLEWFEGFRPGLISNGSDQVGNEVPFTKSRPTVCTDQPFLDETFFLMPCLVDEEPIKNTVNYIEPCFPLGYCPTSYTYVKWYEKSDETISFIWVVRAPEAKAIFNPFDVFGDDAIPSMVAAAHAKPVGGTIVDSEDEYRVKMEPLTSAAMYLAPEAAFNGGNYDEIFEKWRRIFY